MEFSMNTAAIKRMTIIQELSRIPETRLDTVKTYLDTLLMDIQTPPLKNQSLKGIWKDAGFEKLADLEGEQGIWKDAGFEKLADLEGELHTVREELQDTILKQKV
jgi:hypothetical protein